ncbi:hypothetical protein EDB84DRAFT_1474932 [Lactarius hengduanensis]|nr:hypothetical protein EDB84DRAFT_1474932 [Lactarius hengduanensis]
MPKASQSPSKTKKCQSCRASFRPQNLTAHIKKCEREQRERQGEIKYAKTQGEETSRTRGKLRWYVSALGVAIPDEHLTYDLTAANPMDFDAGSETPAREPTPPSVTETTGPSDDPKTLDFAIEYHPNSGRAPKPPGEDSCKRKRPSPPKAEPWCLFFKTREDFLFSEVLMEVGMNKDLTERLIKVVRLCIEGKGSLTFSNYSDIQAAWERASCQLTAFNFHDISVPYNGAVQTFQIPYLWDWAVDLILDSQLAKYFEWDARKVFKHNGKNISRVYDEPWTADMFWNFQSRIPKGVHVLCFILYVDKSKLSSFGSEKAYPVIACCANLPTEIRNSNSGVGGGCIVGWLPDIPETAADSGKPEFINFKRNVWHCAFHCVIDSIIDKSKVGCWLQCADGTSQHFFPGVIILSANYEEQCVMSLIRGIHGKMPSLICFIPNYFFQKIPNPKPNFPNTIPDDQLADVSKTWPPRTTERMQQLIEEGKTLNRSVDREHHFSKYGICDVDNVFWRVDNSDPYHVLSFDRLHSNNNGVFGYHLWKRFKGLFGDTQEGCAAATKFELQFGQAPHWRDLHHFSQVLKVDFMDGGKNEDISKVLVFAAHNLFSLEKNEEWWKLLLCLRSFSILDLLLSLGVHTEETILAGRSELEKFRTLIEVHSFDDVEAKGASRNYNMKPNEKMHSFLRKLYLNRTNFKNVASQILKHKHVALVGELIQGQINELDMAIREQATNDNSDDIGGDTLGSTQGQHIGSSLEPPVQGGSSCQGRRSMFDAGAVILQSQQAPVTFEALEVQRAQDRPFRNFRARLAAWLTDTMPLYRFSFAPDCMCVEFQVDDKVRCGMNQWSNWQQYMDYIYCTPRFHSQERHNFVILKTTNGFIFAELLFIFTTSVAEHQFPICLVHPFDAAIQPRHLHPKSSTEFFFAQSIVRGAPLIPTFDNMSGDHFVMDIVDHNGDLFVHCNEIFGRQFIVVDENSCRTTTEFAIVLLKHATANMRPATARDFSNDKQKPKIRHLCKNVQKAIYYHLTSASVHQNWGPMPSPTGTPHALLSHGVSGGTSLASAMLAAGFPSLSSRPADEARCRSRQIKRGKRGSHPVVCGTGTRASPIPQRATSCHGTT